MPPYTIIRLESFIQKSVRLTESYPTLIEFNKFVNWHVQRSPQTFNREVPSDYFFSISSKDLYTPDLLLEARRVTDFPNVKVIYHINEDKKEVTLICMGMEE